MQSSFHTRRLSPAADLVAAPGSETVARLLAEVRFIHREREAALLDELVPPGPVAVHSREHPVSGYMHAACIEDGVVSELLLRRPPLFATSWAGQIHWTAHTPRGVPPRPRRQRWRRQELIKLRRYVRSVHTNTETYLSNLRPADLLETVDLTGQGAGQLTVAAVVREYLIDPWLRLRRTSAVRPTVPQLHVLDDVDKPESRSSALPTIRAIQRALNTPLTLAFGYAELVANDPRLPDELLPMMQELLGGVEAAVGVLHQMEQVARTGELDPSC